MTTSFHQYLDPQVYRVTQNGFFIVLIHKEQYLSIVCLLQAPKYLPRISMTYVLIQKYPKNNISDHFVFYGSRFLQLYLIYLKYLCIIQIPNTTLVSHLGVIRGNMIKTFKATFERKTYVSFQIRCPLYIF